MKSFIFDRNAQTALKELDTNKIPVYDTLADVDTTDLEVGQIIATKDDKLLIGSTKDVYSTEEVKTGQLWIDNRPIYRKVYISHNMPAQGSNLILDDTFGQDKNLVRWNGGFSRADNSTSKPNYKWPYTLYDLTTALYNNQLRLINVNSNIDSGFYWTIEIIVEYTKTSDSPVEVAGWAPAEIAK